MSDNEAFAPFQPHTPEPAANEKTPKKGKRKTKAAVKPTKPVVAKPKKPRWLA